MKYLYKRFILWFACQPCSEGSRDLFPLPQVVPSILPRVVLDRRVTFAASLAAIRALACSGDGGGRHRDHGC